MGGWGAGAGGVGGRAGVETGCRLGGWKVGGLESGERGALGHALSCWVELSGWSGVVLGRPQVSALGGLAAFIAVRPTNATTPTPQHPQPPTTPPKPHHHHPASAITPPPKAPHQVVQAEVRHRVPQDALLHQQHVASRGADLLDQAQDVVALLLVDAVHLRGGVGGGGISAGRC